MDDSMDFMPSGISNNGIFFRKFFWFRYSLGKNLLPTADFQFLLNPFVRKKSYQKKWNILNFFQKFLQVILQPVLFIYQAKLVLSLFVSLLYRWIHVPMSKNRQNSLIFIIPQLFLAILHIFATKNLCATLKLRFHYILLKFFLQITEQKL